MNIYVGNLHFSTMEDELRRAFEEHGTVNTVSIIKDKFTGDSRGFGFVEMPNQDEAKTAINRVSGQDIGGREVTVNEAKPREERGSSSRGGYSGGNRSGGYGNGDRRSSY